MGGGEGGCVGGGGSVWVWVSVCVDVCLGVFSVIPLSRVMENEIFPNENFCTF